MCKESSLRNYYSTLITPNGYDGSLKKIKKYIFIFLLAIKILDTVNQRKTIVV
jgi:hypothetical protein